MPQDKKDSVILYRSYAKTVALLSPEDAQDLFLTLLDPDSYDADSCLSPGALIAYSMIKSQIDRDSQRYRETCEKNRRNALMRYGR